jgi:dienelactone hydrolase
MRAPLLLLASLLLGLAAVSTPACSTSDEASPAPAAPAVPVYEGLGPHPVGHAIFTLDDPARSRSMTVQIWYPATDAGRDQATAGTPLDELVPNAADRASLAGLLAKAPAGCTSPRTRSAAGLDPIAGPLPLVVFSHCHGCLRFSAFSIAESLASRGVAVIAPDHADDTLFSQLAGGNAPINDAFLATRVGDIKATLDAALAPGAPALPEALRGRFDAARVGMMGHSFGTLTTGATLIADPRIKAAFTMAAPPALLGGVTMTAIKQPIFLLLAREDNSIGEVGNNTIRGNFKDANPPAWLAEVSDAGHWSFSDIAGLAPWLVPGCGEATRQTDKDQTFHYLANDTGRALGSAYAAAFFSLTLLGDEAARPYLAAPHLADVSVSHK